jgi:hypothetical protein
LNYFANLFRALLERLVAVSEPVFYAPLAELRRHFPKIWALDGSRLDAIAHRLQILWDFRSTILPGCREVAYDFTRGIPRVFHFDPEAAAAALRLGPVVRHIPGGSTLLRNQVEGDAIKTALVSRCFARNSMLQKRSI